jgi:hypothetical protein
VKVVITGASIALPIGGWRQPGICSQTSNSQVKNGFELVITGLAAVIHPLQKFFRED